MGGGAHAREMVNPWCLYKQHFIGTLSLSFIHELSVAAWKLHSERSSSDRDREAYKAKNICSLAL